MTDEEKKQIADKARDIERRLHMTYEGWRVSGLSHGGKTYDDFRRFKQVSAAELKKLKTYQKSLRTGRIGLSMGNQMSGEAQARIIEASNAFDAITDPAQIKRLFIANSASHAPALEFGGKTPNGDYFPGFHVLLTQGRDAAQQEFDKAAQDYNAAKSTPIPLAMTG
jgi:hypothetical protein